MATLFAKSYRFQWGPANYSIPAILKERMRELVRYVRQTGVDEVVIAMPWAFLDAVGQVESELRVLPIPIKLVSDQRTARLLDRPLFDFGPTKRPAAAACAPECHAADNETIHGPAVGRIGTHCPAANVCDYQHRNTPGVAGPVVISPAAGRLQRKAVQDL